MLIIFDLDDTLIPTTEIVAPLQLMRSLREMVGRGAMLPLDEAALQVPKLNQKASSGRVVLEELAQRYSIDKKYLEIGIKEFYEGKLADVELTPWKGVKELLSSLKKGNSLALVSKGIYERQLLKLKKAGIDTTLFDKMDILEKGSKKKPYQKLIQQFSVDPSDVLVVGDRVLVDLVPAKELGCITVHVKRGRGAFHTGYENAVDFSVENTADVLEIYRRLTRQKEEA